ncbi:hypothetical protein L3067_01360 [Xanthomonas sp. PPL568]|uniref:hypothetical protein n=1 Tax=Xanthomonas indica TaxID=2912242 RepID=UPI001F58F06C|nr:hypothetical protein [Xanthomonas indica]MCI2243257.1 hypothetical protein [Xanthomonas indica]
MKEQAFGRDTVVLLIMAFGFGALFAWGLSTPPVGKAHAVTSKPIDWPAWVQAVGSVVAICAAVLIARWQRISEQLDTQREHALQARSLGAVLMRDIKLFRDNLERCIGRVESIHYMAALTVSSQVIPAGLWERVADLHRLGVAGGHLLGAIFHQQEAKDLVPEDILWPEAREAYLKQLNLAHQLCEAAIEAIRAMAK